MNLMELLLKIRGDGNYKNEDSKGLPELRDGHILPNDLKEFYLSCGGISLFTDERYGFLVLPPDEFILANPIIVGELCEEDISSEWYTIYKDSEGNFITIEMLYWIDKSVQSLGVAYDE